MKWMKGISNEGEKVWYNEDGEVLTEDEMDALEAKGLLAQDEENDR